MNLWHLLLEAPSGFCVKEKRENALPHQEGNMQALASPNPDVPRECSSALVAPSKAAWSSLQAGRPEPHATLTTEPGEDKEGTESMESQWLQACGSSVWFGNKSKCEQQSLPSLYPAPDRAPSPNSMSAPD